MISELKESAGSDRVQTSAIDIRKAEFYRSLDWDEHANFEQENEIQLVYYK